MRIRILAVVAMSLLPLAAVGCGDDDDDRPNPRGWQGGERGAATASPEAPSTAPTPAGTKAPVRPGLRQVPVGEVPPQGQKLAKKLAEDEEEEEDEAPERDLAEELRRAVGNVAECIPRGTPATGRHTFRLQAVITSTGVVTRAYVTASGLPPEAAECARRRVERVRFPGPIPDAPRTVSASVEVEPAPTKTPPGEGAASQP